MVHYVVTRNFEDTKNRTDFIEAFENALASLGIALQETNQSTYFGKYNGTSTSPQAFLTRLHGLIKDLDWRRDDIVTIYYPKPTKIGENNKADIGEHNYKNEGSNTLYDTI